MSKDNHEIDDILSEVKSRKENAEKVEATQEQTEEIAAPSDEAEIQADEEAEDTPQSEEELISESVEEAEDTEAEEESAENAEEEGLVDLYSIDTEKEAEPEEEEKAEPQDKKSKRKKIVKIIIALLLIVAIVVGAAVGGIFLEVYRIANGLHDDEEIKNSVMDEWTGMEDLEYKERFTPITEAEASQVASFQDMIKQWYYNGTPASSNHVMNVLLVGEDTRGDDIKTKGTRADSVVLCSINIDTKRVTLTSILRDTWAYWEDTPGDESTGKFGKINGAMASGGINAYVNAVERLYKVEINNYVIVNFDSFISIINTMGGIDLKLTAAEINEINNHPKVYGNVTIEKTFDGNEGTIHLTGKQALAYCRIRHLDSDNVRADRQKKVLTKMVNDAKKSNLTTLLKMLKTIVASNNGKSKMIKTNMPADHILKLANYAYKNNWLKFDMYSTNMPEYRLLEKGAGGQYAFAGNQWIWKADFPRDAYAVQTLIYGKSSITLANVRVDHINCTETGFFEDGSPAVWATIQNDSYGEVTKIPTTKKK